PRPRPGRGETCESRSNRGYARAHARSVQSWRSAPCLPPSWVDPPCSRGTGRLSLRPPPQTLLYATLTSRGGRGQPSSRQSAACAAPTRRLTHLFHVKLLPGKSAFCKGPPE